MAFAILAIFQRSAGGLIAGLLLLGTGTGIALGRTARLGIPATNWLFLSLGLAFVAMYLLGLLLRTGKHWWPLVPGMTLLLLGGAQYASRVDLVPQGVQTLLRTWWPAGLVLAGAILLLRALRVEPHDNNQHVAAARPELFRRLSSATVVPCRRAMSYSVSPAWTT